MGTSRNDPSPTTHPWRMANALLGRPNIEVARQLKQIWRAARADMGEELQESFAHPALGEGCRIAALGLAPAEAVEAFDTYVSEERVASLPVDIARRALARASASDGGAEAFASELFSEASAYYAARDLPSVVGAEDRIQSVSLALTLKRDLRHRTAEIVRLAGRAPGFEDDWPSYVADVLARLRAGGG